MKDAWYFESLSALFHSDLSRREIDFKLAKSLSQLATIINLCNVQKPLSVVKSISGLVRLVYFNKSIVRTI